MTSAVFYSFCFLKDHQTEQKKRFSGPHLYLTALGGERVQALQAEAEQLLKCSLLWSSQYHSPHRQRASPASILGRVWRGVSSRTFQLGSEPFFTQRKVNSRVLRGV